MVVSQNDIDLAWWWLQMLTRASTSSMLQLLHSVLAYFASNNPSAVPASAKALVSELWAAVLDILQQGAPAAKLSVVSHHCFPLFMLGL